MYLILGIKNALEELGSYNASYYRICERQKIENIGGYGRSSHYR